MDYQISRLDTEVDNVRETTLIAISSGEFVGIVSLVHQDRRSACLRQLFVEPQHRHLGIGSALVNECCQIAKDSGAHTVGLSLSSQNRGVQPFYDRLGFMLAFEFDDGISVLSKPV